MSDRSIFRGVAIGAVLLLMAACTREAYIYKEGEFDRSRADFAKELTDRKDLDICYAKQTTTPQDLLAMANAECGRFGKEAVFRKQFLTDCPLLTPVRAHFACVKR